MQTLRPDTYGCPRADAIRNQPMKAPLYFLLMIILLFLFQGGCMSPQEQEMTMTLNRLERQLDSLPGRESGRPFIDTLKAIPASALSSAPLRAYHALVLTQARRKERLFLNEDSLIRNAYNYYAGTSDMYHLMKAALYLSIANRQDGDYEKAFYHAIRAYHLANKLNSPIWIARSAEQRSLLARDRYYHDEEYEYGKIAAIHYDKAGFKVNSQYCIIDLADHYGAIHLYQRGEQLLDSIIANAVDSSVLFAALSSSIDNLLSQKKYDKGIAYMEQMEQMQDFGIWSAGDYLNQAQIAIYKGENPFPYLADARKDIEFVGLKAIYYSILMDYYNNNHSFKDALIYADSLLLIENDFLRESFNENTSIQTKKFYEETSRQVGDDFSRTSDIILYIIFFLDLITIIYLMIFYFRNIIKTRIISSARHILHNKTAAHNILLLKQLTEYFNTNQRLTQENISLVNNQAELFKQQWGTLNLLCKEYLSSDDYNINRKNVYSQLEKQLHLIKQEDQLNTLLQQADIYLNGLLTLFQTECPNLSPAFYRLFGLIAVGFSPKTISFLSDISISNFYVKKKRLTEKIQSIEPPHLDLFMRLL